MPNHITNIITIKENEKVAEIFNAIKSDRDGLGSIDFEKLIPMPKHIFRGNLGLEEQNKYGSDNWYDWSIQNWGTKWNAYDFTEYNEGNSISFYTAWSPPLPIYAKLSEMFPETVFHFQWADEDFGNNVGELYYQNNQEISSNIPTGGSKEAYELAALIQGINLEESGYIYNEESCTYEFNEEE